MSEIEEISKAVQDGSKVASKLVDKIASATGYLFDIKKHAKQAQKSIIDEIASRDDIHPLERAALLSDFKKTVKHYKNSYYIFENAVENLKPNSSPENISDDWLEAFFDKAEKVSEKEIQIVWGKILSEEVNQPGSISKSLIDTIYNLDNDTAKIFNVVCNYSFGRGDVEEFDSVFIRWKSNKEKFEKKGITLTSLTELQRHGLISFNPLTEYAIENIDGDIIIKLKNVKYLISPENNLIRVGNVMLTNDGKALCKCIPTCMCSDVIDMIEDYYGNLIKEKYINMGNNNYYKVDLDHKNIIDK